MKYLPLLIFIAVSFTFIETGYTHGGRLAADGCHNQKAQAPDIVTAPSHPAKDPPPLPPEPLHQQLHQAKAPPAA